MSRDDAIVWSMYFSGIVAMKFHPRNEVERFAPAEISGIVARAAGVADKMLEQYHERFRVVDSDVGAS